MSNQQPPLPPIDDDFLEYKAADLPPELRDGDDDFATTLALASFFFSFIALVLASVAILRTI